MWLIPKVVTEKKSNFWDQYIFNSLIYFLIHILLHISRLSHQIIFFTTYATFVSLLVKEHISIELQSSLTVKSC